MSEPDLAKPGRRRAGTTVTLLALAAAVEAAMGLALMAYPPLVGRLLLGAGLSPAGVALGRVAGFALLSLGVACWPGRETASGRSPALRAMVVYNVLATIYLVRLGLGGELTGRFLWPAVAFHAALAFLLARAWFRRPESVEVK